MKTIRWGMIGCGDVTEVKSGPALQKAKNSQLVAVTSRTAARAKDYALRHKVPKWFATAEELIQDPEVDAIYVATPPSSHMDYSLKAAQAGKPVYVEKPMARTHEECQVMIGACKNAGVPLFVAYYRRLLPRFLKVKELLDSGGIGEVRFVTLSLCQPPREEDRDPGKLPWRVLPEISGGGRFVDLASHMLDFLDFALGPIVEVRGIASNQGRLYPAEDIVTASFAFRSGVQGAGVWCFTVFDSADVTEIVGTAGKITYATFSGSPVVWTTSGGAKEFALETPVHIQQPLIESVVQELNGEGKCPSTGESAARTSWVMDRILGRIFERPEQVGPLSSRARA